MTEAEWNACTDPERMLEHLGSGASARKLRLFLVACARRVLPADPDADMLRALALAEQFADGTATRYQLDRARSSLKRSHPERVARWDPLYTPHHRSIPAWHATREQIARAVREGPRCCAWSSTRTMSGGFVSMTYPNAELAAQAHLLREIFGNPVCPFVLTRTWKTPIIKALAQAAYEERILPHGELDTVRLAVLADALDEVGAEAPLLDHLRGPGPHTRGCWALDAVLGRD